MDWSTRSICSFLQDGFLPYVIAGTNSYLSIGIQYQVGYVLDGSSPIYKPTMNKMATVSIHSYHLVYFFSIGIQNKVSYVLYGSSPIYIPQMN